MQGAAVLSLPSVAVASGDNEGLGLVLLEAQAMGVPVVAFAQGPIPEAVKHEETGFLAPPRDVGKLSEYLSRCLVDGALRRRLGECGKRFVHSAFDLSHQAKVLEGIYDNVVADYARGHG
jgi:glycosyltransferase involved in cell wall biosynthesis